MTTEPRPERNLHQWAFHEITARDLPRVELDVFGVSSWQCGATCVIAMRTRESWGVSASISVSRRGGFPQQRDVDRALADLVPPISRWRESATSEKVRIFELVDPAEPRPQ